MDPIIAMLTRVMAAAGCRLELSLEPIDQTIPGCMAWAMAGDVCRERVDRTAVQASPGPVIQNRRPGVAVSWPDPGPGPGRGATAGP